MIRRNVTRIYLLVVFATLTAPAAAQELQHITHTFKSAAGETGWSLYVRQRFGLTVASAYFMRKQGDWVKVIHEAQLSQMLVPYYAGSPRYWDLHSTTGLDELSADDAGAHGALITLDGKPRVVREVRDVGPVWKEPDGPAKVRRGQALVVWGAVTVGRYCYLIQYSFHDDGTVSFRAGSTGFLQLGLAPHTHTALWRIDVDLGAASPNSVMLMEHQEPAADALQAESIEVGIAKEGFVDWRPNHFTMLRIHNDSLMVSYDLMTMRAGSARHFDQDEHSTQHDFWITRYRSDEIDYQGVPQYVADKESVEESDLVLWCSSSMPHEVRKQDQTITYAMWTGIDLRPRDLFDTAPHYP